MAELRSVGARGAALGEMVRAATRDARWPTWREGGDAVGRMAARGAVRLEMFRTNWRASAVADAK